MAGFYDPMGYFRPGMREATGIITIEWLREMYYGKTALYQGERVKIAYAYQNQYPGRHWFNWVLLGRSESDEYRRIVFEMSNSCSDILEKLPIVD